MLLRSSSTSIVQTIYSYSPTRDFDTNHTKTKHSSLSSTSSPSYISLFGISKSNRKKNCSRGGIIRRAQSESNLEGLVSPSIDLGEEYKLKEDCRSLDKDCNTMLYSEPSFAIYNTNEELDETNENRESKMEKLVKRDGSGEFCFGRSAMGLIEEDEENEDEKEEKLNGLMKDLVIKEKEESDDSSVYRVAEHIGDGDGFGGDAENYGGDVREYYERMLGVEPCNPLFLRNYAQFLQLQGDLYGAEEYYYRATLADPKDGEILMQYAKLVWELHRDREKASSYFERAVFAASEDSNVHAAYASFLWEIEESDEEDSLHDVNVQVEEKSSQVDLQNPESVDEVDIPVSPRLHLASGLGIDSIGFGGDIGSTVDYAAIYSAGSGNIEEYYTRMVEENPSNPLFLRNYAEFLCQSAGDLQRAEEYYFRAILADPSDGEMISQYAKLVWQLHRNKDKTLSYFHRAVRASPENSNVLAAYAAFLWEIDEDEGDDDIVWENHDHESTLKGVKTVATT